MLPRRVLVVYGTTYGHTEKVARYIQNVLVAEGHEVTLEAAAAWRPEWNVHGYDVVIVGASVIARKHQRSVAKFVRANRAALNRLTSAFFSVSGSAAGTDPRATADLDRIVTRFLAGLQWHPRTVEKVAGAITYTRYALPIRWILKWITGRSGGPTDTSRDHELTDWQQVRHFARRVMELAGASAPEEASARA